MAITIQTFMVSNDLKSISLDIEVDAGQTVTKLLVWNQDTYKDPSKQIDLSDLAIEASNVESITIPASDLGESLLTGLYILQVETSNSEASLIATASFTQYYKIQATFIAGIDLSCLSCNADFQNALLFDLYLEGTINALVLGRFQDAIDHLSKLNVISKSSECVDCLDIDPLVSTAGNIVSVGVIDCQLTTV